LNNFLNCKLDTVFIFQGGSHHRNLWWKYVCQKRWHISWLSFSVFIIYIDTFRWKTVV